MVPLPVTDFFEASKCIFQRCDFPRLSSEDFGDEEGLREESFQTSGTMHDHLVIFTQFIDTENCDNILQFAVTLQNGLNLTSDLVMAIANILWVQNSTGGSQWIHRRVNPFRCNISFQIKECIQVSKGRCRSRVCWVVRRYVNRLNGSNSSLFSRSDSFL